MVRRNSYGVNGHGVNDFTGRQTSETYRHVAKHFVLEIGKSNPKILDMACGTADYSQMLRVRGAKLYGLDISFDGLRTAVGLDGKIAGSCLRLPFIDETFGGVHFKDGLVHVPWRRQLAREVRRVLVDGGVWCVTSAENRIPYKVPGVMPYFVTRRADFLNDVAEAGFRLITDTEWVPADMRHDWYDKKIVPRFVVYLKKT